MHGYLLEQPDAASLVALHDLYKELIPDTGTPTRTYLDGRESWIVERFAEHVVIGWLWDLEGFGLEGLLGDLVSTATDKVRAHIAWFIHSDFPELSDAERAVRADRLDEYWAFRSERLKSIPFDQKSEELSAFASWPLMLGLSMDKTEGRVNLIVDHVSYGHAYEQIIDYLLGRAAAGEVTAAVTMLDRIVRRWEGSDEIYWSARSLARAIEELLRLSEDEDKRRLRAVISRLAESGVIDLRGLLEGPA
jgi:hypothetical protein